MGQGFGRLSPGGTGYSCRCGKLNGGFAPAAPAIPAAVENSMGAFPRRHWLSLPLWCPRGGLPFWLPVAPAFSLFVCSYPPDPRSQSALPRRRRGRPKLFFARGFAPCIPSIRPPAALVRPATAFARRGAVSCRACFACRINAFLPPIPPTPFPAGRGRPKLFHARGFAPCIPGIRPPAALARPAAVENSMRAFPPGGTGYPCPGGEDHLKRRSSSPPVPPLLGCRHCSRKSLSVGFAANHRFKPGDARGEAPCIRKLKSPPSPPGKGVGGIGGKNKVKAKVSRQPTGCAPPPPQKNLPHPPGSWHIVQRVYGKYGKSAEI